MPEPEQLISFLLSGEARLVASAILFALFAALKKVPAVRDRLLTTPRRKQAAAMFVAMAPAVWLLSEGAPWVEVVASAVGIALMANGINTYRPSKS